MADQIFRGGRDVIEEFLGKDTMDEFRRFMGPNTDPTRRPEEAVPPIPSSPAYLGVGTRSVKGGLLVMSVGKNNSQGEETAAHRAGLQEGDVLLSIDAEPSTSPMQLRRFLAGFSAGDTVRIAFERAGERKTVQVKLGSP